MPWILIAIAVLVVLLLIAALVLVKKESRKPDYYALFFMGLIWLPLGIPLKNIALSGMGAVFLVVGLLNRDKWKENRKKWSDLSEGQKRLKTILIIGLGVLVLAGMVAYYFAEKGMF